MIKTRPFSDGKNDKGNKNKKQLNGLFSSFNNYLQKSKQKKAHNSLTKTYDQSIKIQKLNFSSTASSNGFLPPKSLNSRDKYNMSKTNRNFNLRSNQQFLKSFSETQTSKQKTVAFKQAMMQQQCHLNSRQLKMKIQNNAMQRFKEMFKKQTGIRAKKIQDQQSKRMMGLLEGTSRSRRERQNQPKQSGQGYNQGESRKSHMYFKKPAKAYIQQAEFYESSIKQISQVKQNKQKNHKAKTLINFESNEINSQESNQQLNLNKKSDNSNQNEGKWCGRDDSQNKLPKQGMKGQVHTKIKEQKQQYCKKQQTDQRICKDTQEKTQQNIAQKWALKQQLRLKLIPNQSGQKLLNQVVKGNNNQQKHPVQPIKQIQIQRDNSPLLNLQKQEQKAKQTNLELHSRKQDNLFKNDVSKQTVHNDKVGTVQLSAKKNVFQPMFDLNSLPEAYTTQRNEDSKDGQRCIQQSKQGKYKNQNQKELTEQIQNEQSQYQRIGRLATNIATQSPINSLSCKKQISIKTPKQIKAVQGSKHKNQQPNNKIYSSRHDDQFDDDLDVVAIQKQGTKSSGLNPSLRRQGQSSGLNPSLRRQGHSKTDEPQRTHNNQGIPTYKIEDMPNETKRSITSLSQTIEKNNINRNEVTRTAQNTGCKNIRQGVEAKQICLSSSRQIFEQGSQQQNGVVQQLFYLISLVETIGGYNNSSKQFYSNTDSSMVQVVMNHKLAAYYVSQQFYFYEHLFMEFLYKRKRGQFYSLSPCQLQQALQDQESIQSIQQLKRSLQMTPKLIKHTYQKCKVYLNKQQKILSMQPTSNYHQKCVKYLKSQFRGLHNIYQHNRTKNLAERLCFLVEIYCVIMSLNGNELKQFQQLQDIGQQNYHKHLLNYQQILLN